MKISSFPIILSITLATFLLFLVSCDKPSTIVSQNSSSQSGIDSTDQELAGQIRSALLLDEISAPVQIAIVVTKGDARLTGEVATQQQLNQTIKIATAVEGVHTIHNELSVKK